LKVLRFQRLVLWWLLKIARMVEEIKVMAVSYVSNSSMNEGTQQGLGCLL
jgi:hypothetical protein